MTEIKFGTDGWRAIIAAEYTVENVRRVAQGTALWMQSNDMSKAVVGYDCRFGGLMFAKITAQTLAAQGIKVALDQAFVSTPMVSLGVVKSQADMGVVITASHNPPSYNGFKLKSAYGGPTIPSDVKAVEDLIPEGPVAITTSYEKLVEDGLIEYVDLEDMYVKHVEDHFDLDLIRQSGIRLAYDAMYGSGQNAIRRLFPEAVLLHCDHNPGFHGQAPEPIHRNLQELSNLMKLSHDLDLGLANDGDADRIGLYDEKGRFVDSHHILLLLLHYLRNYKQYTGKVVITFSVTDKMKKLAEAYGFDLVVTPIGFKYIAEIMTKEDVIVGGEESGGLAVKGHIPERDGIWNGLIVMEFMAKTGKSLSKLIDEVYEEVGAFAFDRDDLHLAEDKKQSIIHRCKTEPFEKFGSYDVVRMENVDGYKFYLSEDDWVLIRPSGTEPVLRVYCQSTNQDEVNKRLKAVHTELNALS